MVDVEAGDGRETPDGWVKVDTEPETPFEQYGMPAAKPALPFDKYGFLITDELPADKRPARVDERNRGFPRPVHMRALRENGIILGFEFRMSCSPSDRHPQTDTSRTASSIRTAHNGCGTSSSPAGMDSLPTR